MSDKRKEESADALINRPFNTLSDKDMDILRKAAAPPQFSEPRSLYV
jgi:hypothetical protein